MNDTGTTAKTPEMFVRDFLDELDDPKTFLRTERVNALGAFDTRNWGKAGKSAIAAALRAPRLNTMKHPTTCPCTECT